MELIAREDLSLYCRHNGDKIQGRIRHIVIEFQGLNRYEMIHEPSPLELELGSRNILYVIPYLAPWLWMNDSARAYTDLVLESMEKAFHLPKETSVISTGYSMGGLSALLYAMYRKDVVTACYANSPVCDLAAHFQERPDIPRTLLNAFISSEAGFWEELHRHSPVHMVKEFGNIPYFLVAGGLDREVDKKVHSDRLVELLRQEGKTVIYYELEDMRHWQITDYGVYRAYVEFLCG